MQRGLVALGAVPVMSIPAAGATETDELIALDN